MTTQGKGNPCGNGLSGGRSLDLQMFLSRCSQWVRAGLSRTHALIVVAVVAASVVAIVLMAQGERAPKVTVNGDADVSSQARRPARFTPTAAQWASLGIEPCKQISFRSEHTTEGKISINEERSTPIYPPYAGRVTRLMAKPGDIVKAGDPLFYIEAAAML